MAPSSGSALALAATLRALDDDALERLIRERQIRRQGIRDYFDNAVAYTKAREYRFVSGQVKFQPRVAGSWTEPFDRPENHPKDLRFEAMMLRADLLLSQDQLQARNSRVNRKFQNYVGNWFETFKS